MAFAEDGVVDAVEAVACDKPEVEEELVEPAVACVGPEAMGCGDDAEAARGVVDVASRAAPSAAPPSAACAEPHASFPGHGALPTSRADHAPGSTAWVNGEGASCGRVLARRKQPDV